MRGSTVQYSAICGIDNGIIKRKNESVQATKCLKWFSKVKGVYLRTVQ